MSEIPPKHHSRWAPFCKYSDPSIIELLPIVDLLLITLITYLLCLQYHRYTEVRPLASRLLGGNALWILRSNGMLDTKYIQRPNIQGFEAKENKDYNPSPRDTLDHIKSVTQKNQKFPPSRISYPRLPWLRMLIKNQTF